MSLPYRPCVGIMLLNDNNRVFVAQRNDVISEYWQMPQGGIDTDETPENAAMRELEEEIGTTNATIIAETKHWLHYDFPDDLYAQLWGGKYKGQKQKWFAMRFNGHDDDINIDTEEPEFRTWKWEDPSCLPDIIVPFKVELYKTLLNEFRTLLT